MKAASLLLIGLVAARAEFVAADAAAPASAPAGTIASDASPNLSIPPADSAAPAVTAPPEAAPEVQVTTPAGSVASDPQTSAPHATAPALPATSSTAARQIVQHDRATFVLASSSAGQNVQTDEYTLETETLATWTQLVTVQRITLSRPTTVEDFVSYFQSRLDAGGSLEVLRRSKHVSVFAVRFARTELNDEQVMICLAFADRVKPSLLNIVQYALKPSLTSDATVKTNLKSWRDRFLAQAHALGADSG